MLAPAEKNLSPCPVIKITLTSSPKRALRMASSMSCHISLVYVLTAVFPSSRGAPSESDINSIMAIPLSVTP